MYNTWFDKLEDWFLELAFIDGKWPEDFYFMLCRFLSRVQDILWYGPTIFIKNMVRFAPILWSDRWFDYHYLLNMMRVKLEHDAKMYRKYGMCTNSGEAAKQMEHCAELLKKIDDDNYDTEHLEPHDKKWGDMSFNFTKKDDGSIMMGSRPNVITDEDKELERKEFMEYIEAADIERNNDIKTLFGVMSKNLRTWWD